MFPSGGQTNTDSPLQLHIRSWCPIIEGSGGSFLTQVQHSCSTQCILFFFLSGNSNQKQIALTRILQIDADACFRGVNTGKHLFGLTHFKLN